MVKVSVIIPVYNAEEYLESALDSVLGQEFTDIEVICINDGSTDSSKDILEKYQAQDARVKVVNQKNGGGSAARNKGLSHAKAECIMFLDADDMLAPGIIGAAYDRTLKTNAEVVFYNFARFVGKPTRLAVVSRTTPGNDLEYFTHKTYADGFFNDFAIITWNKLVKRAVIDRSKLTFNTKLSHNHDVDFSIRLMLAAESFSYVDMVGYYYRDNDSGLTATRRSDPTNVLRILVELNESLVGKHNPLKPSYDSYVAEMIAGTIVKYSGSASKQKEVFDYAQKNVIPMLGAGAGDKSRSREIFELVKDGDYSKLRTYMNHPKRKLRRYFRGAYDELQGVLARFTV